MNWLDIGVCIIIGFEVFKCFKDGMVKSVIHMAGLIVSLIVAKMYYKTVADYLYAHFGFFKTLEPTIFNGLTQNFSDKAQLTSAVDNGTFSTAMHLPKAMDFAMHNQSTQITNSINQAVFGELSKKIAEFMLYGISFTGIVVSLMVAIMIVTFVIDQIMGLPVLNEINKLGGIAVGFVKGALNVFIVMTVLTFVLPFVKWPFIMDALNQSQIALYFYNNNILLYLIYFLLK